VSLVLGICVVCYKRRGVVATTWLGDNAAGVCRKCAPSKDGQRELKRAGESG